MPVHAYENEPAKRPWRIALFDWLCMPANLWLILCSHICKVEFNVQVGLPGMVVTLARNRIAVDQQRAFMMHLLHMLPENGEVHPDYAEAVAVFLDATDGKLVYDPTSDFAESVLANTQGE